VVLAEGGVVFSGASDVGYFVAAEVVYSGGGAITSEANCSGAV
jgi:hypothetical protein